MHAEQPTIGPREPILNTEGKPIPIAHSRVINGKEFTFIRLMGCPRTVVAIESGTNGSVRHEWRDDGHQTCHHR